MCSSNVKIKLHWVSIVKKISMGEHFNLILVTLG